MRKLLAALLLCFALFLNGCSFIFPDEESSAPSAESADNTTDFSREIENKWCYQRLNTDLKSDYEEVYAAVQEGFNRNEKVTITDSGQETKNEYTGIKIKLSQPLHDREEAQLLYTAFTTDNPQFFYIGNFYSYEGYRSGNVDNYNQFYLVYTMDAEQRGDASRQMETVVDSMLKEAKQKAGSNQYELELLLHDKLMAMCTYEDKAGEDAEAIDQYPTAFTSYGALVEGRAVCEGYSRAMQLLLNRAGIDCTLVSGFDDSKTAHMWNFVTIDGKNYHLDPTWDDTGDLLRHTYFNLTTEEIVRSHVLDTDNIGIDTCTASDANYYRASELYFPSIQRDDIARAIAAKVRDGETVIDMEFTKYSFANARLFINNRTLLDEKVNALLKPYNLMMWDYQNYNIDETYYTITLYKPQS